MGIGGTSPVDSGTGTTGWRKDRNSVFVFSFSAIGTTETTFPARVGVLIHELGEDSGRVLVLSVHDRGSDLVFPSLHSEAQYSAIAQEEEGYPAWMAARRMRISPF